MIANGKPVQGLDIPIVKLVPRTERKVNERYKKRIEASLRAVGLLEPLIVFPLGDSYEILDGNLRYRLLLEMGVETVPCLIGAEREAFTGNRMVNQLSASQEMRMLRKSLEELDEKTIAAALGMPERKATRCWSPPAVLSATIRIVLHLCHRAANVGTHIAPSAVFNCRHYGVSRPQRYAAALGDEPRRCTGMLFRDILATKPPPAFSQLWNQDLLDWMTRNLISEGVPA